ncbi:MAG: HEAT repeat domain-containing protein [Elusimicrobiota bacterium]
MRTGLLCLLLAGPAWAAPNSCRDFRAEGRKLRLGFPSSVRNVINCGPGEYEPSEYILATHPRAPLEMHVVSVREGSFPPGEEHARKAPGMRGVRVVVYKTRLPAIVALSGEKPVLWDVTLTQDARVDRVVLQGSPEHVVRGLPETVPVIRRSREETCGAFAYGWEPRQNIGGGDYRSMIVNLRCATGLRESSFQGCYAGAVFEIPHYKKEPERPKSWEPPCPLPIEPGLVTFTPEEAAEMKVPYKGSPQEVRPVKTPRVFQGEDLPRPEPSPQVEERPAPRTALPEARKPPTGPKEDLGRPSGVPAREGIPTRALAILLEGQAGLATHDAIPDLLLALEKGGTLLRWRAADELGKMGAAADTAVDPLIRALKDPEARVRSSAALALGNIGPAAAKSVKRLKKLLDDDSADVRHSAEVALGRIGTKDALRILERRRRR